MSRIRSIKPEFPQSESIGKLSRDARLLFIQLWTISDDFGRARASSRLLASLLYPYDNDAPKLMDRWLDELEQNECIRQYVVDGSNYLQIINWLKHQKIDHPSKIGLPPPPEVLASPREVLAPDLGPRIGEDLGSKTATKPKKVSTQSCAVAAATRIGLDDQFDQFWKAYPKRKGSNPKHPAKTKFAAAIKSGVNPQAIIAGAKRYAAEASEQKQVGTPYVAQAIVFLNQQRWGDYAPAPSEADHVNGKGWRPGLPTSEELRKKYAAENSQSEDSGLVRSGGEPREAA